MRNLRATTALGYAVRSARRSPWFTATAVLTLAIGIGGTVAIFSLVNGWLIRPLPYEDADRLVHLRGEEAANHAVVRADFQALAERVRALEEVAVLRPWGVALRETDGTLTRRAAASVSWNYFRILGARPAAGRFFLPEEGPAGAPVVVLSHGLWQRGFGSRADAVGEDLTVDGVSYTVVGVAPRTFEDPIALDVLGWEEGPALWRPIPPDYGETESSVAYWTIARLRPGTPPEAADREVRATFRDLYPGWEDRPHRLESFREVRVGGIRPTLLLLLAGAGLLLLTAAGNLGTLLLSRAIGRRDELAVRASLGATRRRLIGQLLAEALLVSAAGGLGGLLVARWAVHLLTGLGGYGLPGQHGIGLDARVFAFAGLACGLTALAAGLLPAVRLTGTALSGALRGGGRGSVSAVGERPRRLLVIGETAMTVVLLVGAGLLFRSLWNFQALDPGFDPAGALTVRVGLAGDRYPVPEAQVNALEALIERIRALPGVRAVAAVSDLPMSGAINATGVQRGPDDEERPSALTRAVTRSYFETMEIPLLRGRLFAPADREGALPVAIIDRALADRLYPGGEPVGRSVTVRGVEREIVGVVGNVVQFDLGEEAERTFYTPYAQERAEWMRASMTLLVRATADPGALAGPVRAAIRQVDPSIPVSDGRTLDSYVEEDLAGPRSRALVVLFFAAVALTMSAAGLAGVLAFAVNRRRREIGLRLALGADPAVVTRDVLARAGRLVGIGLAAGVAGALLAGRLMSGFLFRVAPADPAVLVSVTGLLGVVAVLAAYLPARRAASVNPAEVLRLD